MLNAASRDLGVPPYLAKLTDVLRSQTFTRTVFLFGSYARGDQDESSDIDILVITHGEKLLSEILSLVPDLEIKTKLSLAPYSSSIFVALYKSGSLFVKHLITEGKLLYDDGFYTTLSRQPFPDSFEDSVRELNLIKDRLTLYSDLSIFNGLLFDFYTRIYLMTCDLAIVGLALRNEPQFNKSKA